MDVEPMQALYRDGDIVHRSDLLTLPSCKDFNRPSSARMSARVIPERDSASKPSVHSGAVRIKNTTTENPAACVLSTPNKLRPKTVKN